MMGPEESSTLESPASATAFGAGLEVGVGVGVGVAGVGVGGRMVSVVFVAALTVGAASTVTPRAADSTAVESVVSLAAAATAVDLVSVTVATTLTLPAVTAMATWHSGALHPR